MPRLEIFFLPYETGPVFLTMLLSIATGLHPTLLCNNSILSLCDNCPVTYAKKGGSCSSLWAHFQIVKLTSHLSLMDTLRETKE